MVAIELCIFVDLRDRSKEFFEKQLKDSKTVNGSSVSAHLKAAVKQDIANGMSEDEAHAKWKVPKNTKQELPAKDVMYIYSMYHELMNCRTYGMSGLNPISLHDIRVYEERYTTISEPILRILYDLDEIYYSLKD